MSHFEWSPVGTAARLKELEAERDHACKLVAQMHHAATGYIQGPIRGVVEDIAETEREELRAEVERLRALNVELLEALKLAQQIIGHPDDAHSKLIAAAIAQTEGQR
jgi:hypothetical protein